MAFYEEAATHGDLYVGIGSDRTISDLKGRRTVNGERERLYIIKSLKVVKDAWINRGSTGWIMLRASTGLRRSPRWLTLRFLTGRRRRRRLSGACLGETN